MCNCGATGEYKVIHKYKITNYFSPPLGNTFFFY